MSKSFRILASIWAVVQLGRLIAIPLIQSVAAGLDDPAWMFPAIVDVVVAAGVPVALWAIWRGRGFASWLYLVLWMALSIVDHASAITAFLVAGVPSVFESFGDQGYLAPALQTLFDAAIIVALVRVKTRATMRLAG